MLGGCSSIYVQIEWKHVVPTTVRQQSTVCFVLHVTLIKATLHVCPQQCRKKIPSVDGLNTFATLVLRFIEVTNQHGLKIWVSQMKGL